MDGIFGCRWFDVLIKILTFCIVVLPNRVKPVRHSEVLGYPTGEV
jgi:hypothetical protein